MSSIQSSCSKKIRYTTKAKANAAIRFQRKNTGKCMPLLQAYHCDYCDGWHFGNMSNIRHVERLLESVKKK